MISRGFAPCCIEFVDVARRKFVGVAVLGTVFAAAGMPARAADKVRRVGYLGNVPLERGGSPRIWRAFVEALAERGYVEGKNAAFDIRYVEGRLERVPTLVAELVRVPVDVIVVGSGPGVRAAKEATSTIPIVMIGVSDPVGAGLIASLARPGGNVTGMADLQIDLIPKRMQLLKTLAPTIGRLAFVHGSYSGFDKARADEESRRRAAAAVALGIELVDIPMNAPQDFEAATAAVVQSRADALLVSPNPTNFILRKEIAAFASARRMPAIAARREEAEAGILMSYGPSVSDIFRNAAIYTAKILDGANPADLPVQQPSKLECVVNLATAKSLELRIPPSLQVDELI